MSEMATVSVVERPREAGESNGRRPCDQIEYDFPKSRGEDRQLRKIVVALGTPCGLILGAALALAQAPAPSLPDVPNPKVAAEAPEIGRYGGTYVVSSISDPRTFNPVVAQETSSTVVTGVIFEALVEQNYITGEIEPGLAEAWAVSEGGRTWTFTLRQGVRWTDGKPLTIDDIVFSLEAVFADGVQSSTRDLLTIEDKPIRWRKVDDRRIAFTTEKPVGTFLRLIGALDVIPRHKLGDALAKGGAEFNRTYGINTAAREIVGTGPFILQSYVPGQRVTLLRNPTYWKVDKKGNRLPYLTRYVILIVPTTEAARLKFLAKETDLYSARPREFAEFKQGEKAGNYTIYDGPETFSSEFLVLNHNPAGTTAPKLTWFQDVLFRRALNHAIDRKTIAEQVYAGRASAAWGPVSSGNALYYNPKLPQYPYDVDRAQQLLAEAGYRKGTDGVLRDPQGSVVEFTIATNAGNQDREAIGNIVRQDFTKLGIRATFAPEAFNTLVDKLVGSFKWEAIVIGLTGGIEPVTGRNVWLSSGSLHMWWPKQEKPATEWEAEIDRLFEQATAEIDQDRRKQLYFRWQEIVAVQVPMMYFSNPKTQPAVRNTLGNIKLGLQGVAGELETLYYKVTYRE